MIHHDNRQQESDSVCDLRKEKDAKEKVQLTHFTKTPIEDATTQHVIWIFSLQKNFIILEFPPKPAALQMAN